MSDRKPMSADDMSRRAAAWWNGAPTPSEPRYPEQIESADDLRSIAVGDIAELWQNARWSQTESDEELPAPLARCAGCGGAGYYLHAVPYGHPHFGKKFMCECQIAEQAEATRLTLMRASGLDSDAWREKTFATFNPNVTGISKAFRRAKAFAENPRGFLSMFGGPGCGKTHLAGAIAHDVLARKHSVYIDTVPDMLDFLKSGYNKESSSYGEKMSQLCDVQLLVLDDIGTESPTAWAQEKMFQIINHRYAYALPTVVTCNQLPKDINPRLLSRLEDRSLAPDGILLIEAEDQRKVKR